MQIGVLRSLTALCGTLQPLPTDRVITLQLYYNEDAPKHYQPPFFTAATFENTPRGGPISLPLKIDVGNIQTVQ